MHRRLSWTLLVALFAPGCIVYDADLLANAEGGGAGVGGTSSGGGSGGDIVTGSGGQTAGSGGDGSGASDGSGGSSTGGSGGDAAGGTSSGGASTGGGATGGTGGDNCVDAGTKTPYTGDLSREVVDSFDDLSREVGSSSFDGNWVVGSDGTGSDLSPVVDGALLNKEQWSCTDTDDLALHITGTGFSSWGASYDANLDLGGDTMDLSTYTHIAVWARLGDSVTQQTYKLGIRDDVGAFETGLKVATSKKWGNYSEFAIPAGVNKSKVKVISIVVSGSDGIGDPVNFDVWFDDLTLIKK